MLSTTSAAPGAGGSRSSLGECAEDKSSTGCPHGKPAPSAGTKLGEPSGAAAPAPRPLPVPRPRPRPPRPPRPILLVGDGVPPAGDAARSLLSGADAGGLLSLSTGAAASMPASEAASVAAPPTALAAGAVVDESTSSDDMSCSSGGGMRGMSAPRGVAIPLSSTASAQEDEGMAASAAGGGSLAGAATASGAGTGDGDDAHACFGKLSAGVDGSSGEAASPAEAPTRDDFGGAASRTAIMCGSPRCDLGVRSNAG